LPFSGSVVQERNGPRAVFPQCVDFQALVDTPAGLQVYRHAMQFSDSTLAALNLGVEEPHDWSRVLFLAVILTVAAASAALLV
jgi:hypothetical protein